MTKSTKTAEMEEWPIWKNLTLQLQKLSQIFINYSNGNSPISTAVFPSKYKSKDKFGARLGWVRLGFIFVKSATDFFCRFYATTRTNRHSPKVITHILDHPPYLNCLYTRKQQVQSHVFVYTGNLRLIYQMLHFFVL